MAHEPAVIVVRAPLALRLRWPLFYTVVSAAWLLLLVLHGSGAGHRAADGARLAAMWAVMAVAMMAPTALPTLRAFAAVADREREASRGAAFWAFSGGFAAVWGAFALVGAALQLGLRGLDLQDRAGGAQPWLAAGLLALAGAYQLLPARAASLDRCRSSAAVLADRWRPGLRGALRLGARHGLDCVGACWALMLLALVSGVAALAWMGLAMLVIGVEKMPAIGWRVTRPLAAALLATAAAVAVGAVLA